jgi:GNAT superfamily N-acetyltransferase
VVVTDALAGQGPVSLRPEGGPAVAALLRESYVAFAAELPPDLFRGWIDNVLDPRGATTPVVLADGTLAGTARLHLAGTYPIPLSAGSVGVRAVAVAPTRRRSGVARALMAASCAERARTGGAAALYQHTAPLHGRGDRPLRGPGLPPRPGGGHRHRRALRGRTTGSAIISAYRLGLVAARRIETAKLRNEGDTVDLSS